MRAGNYTRSIKPNTIRSPPTHSPLPKDSTYWNSRRDKPLTTDEKALYITGTNVVRTEADSSVLTRYLQLGERLTSTVNRDYKSTRVKYSGLLNPFQLSFGSNGITYKQEARISKTFEHDRQLRFHPEIGFLFKEKELRLRLTTDWEYHPERQGILNLTIANDNQSYSSEVIHQINEILKDTPICFEDLNLKYFQHYYAKLMNQIELMNGFRLSAGLAYHYRTPVKKNKDTGLDLKDHNEFTPVIGLTYTPRQYYWMDGYRKEYLHSHYPTFRIELARSIPDLLGCTGNYWRMEAGMNQTVRLGLSERLSYNLSGGLFLTSITCTSPISAISPNVISPSLGAIGLAGSFIIWVGIGTMPPTNIFKGTSCTRAHSFYCDSSSPIPRRINTSCPNVSTSASYGLPYCRITASSGMVSVATFFI